MNNQMNGLSPKYTQDYEEARQEAVKNIE